MSKAIPIHEHGGPDVMRWEDVDVGESGPGQARVRHHAVGVNFIDVCHRSGFYLLPLPSSIGVGGAAVVEAIGLDARRLKYMQLSVPISNRWRPSFSTLCCRARSKLKSTDAIRSAMRRKPIAPFKRVKRLTPPSKST